MIPILMIETVDIYNDGRIEAEFRYVKNSHYLNGRSFTIGLSSKPGNGDIARILSGLQKKGAEMSPEYAIEIMGIYG